MDLDGIGLGGVRVGDNGIRSVDGDADAVVEFGCIIS
jgi:hypothetical protein